MFELLLTSFKKNPLIYLRIRDKNIIVKEFDKEYHILDISENKKEIIYSLVDVKNFTYSAPFEKLSKTFIEQIICQINSKINALVNEEDIAIAESA
jgi:hypothetical protein